MDNIKEEEKIDAEKEVGDWSKPDFTFIAKAMHTWRQSGYYLICHTCDLEHGIYIGADKIMVGMSETNTPILKTRQELNMA